MHRTQLIIENWHHERLVALSESRGQSISALLREILSDYFEERQANGRANLGKIEGIAEGPPDLGRRHDEYLYGEPGES